MIFEEAYVWKEKRIWKSCALQGAMLRLFCPLGLLAALTGLAGGGVGTLFHKAVEYATGVPNRPQLDFYTCCP